jgi:hypothetical protein
MIRLLHLSDIHFSTTGGGGEIDVEMSVRQRMLNDIIKVQDETGPVDAVLVVGDIARTGHEDEYRIAGDFLDEVCDAVHCEQEQVVCVPGNHDINRRAHGPVHAALRHQLRSIPAPRISDTLRDLLTDPRGGPILLEPLQAYNEFALRYGCDLSLQHPIWAPKEKSLGDRVIRFHGVTSCWICDGDDDHEDDAHRVAVGLFQLSSVARDRDVITVTLCHHPSRWLRDGDQVRPWLASSHLVLTGHEHEAGITLSADARSLHVASGAVNPDRSERSWLPAYNLLELDVGDHNLLKIRILVRTWGRERAEFGPDEDRPVVEHEVRLEPRVTSGAPQIQAPEPGTSIDVAAPEKMESETRAIMYSVMSHPPDRRRAVARKLGLLSSAEVLGLAADRELLRNAVDQNRLQELDEALQDG